MNKFIILISVCCCFFQSACSQQKVEPFKQGSQYYDILKEDIVEKLKTHNPENIDQDFYDVEIWVNAILKDKNNVGVYNYGTVGSHGSRRNIFLFDGKSIKIISKTDQVEVIKETSTFLNKHNFTEKEKDDSIEKINKILSEKTTDSF